MACGEDHGEAGCAPAVHRGPRWSRCLPVAHGGSMPEQMDASKGGCDPVGSPHWSRLLPEPVAPWREEPMLVPVYWHGL